MSEVRRDHKGRKLLNGESQRKDGKYEYKYQDARGRRKTVYSWKLTPADRVPAGKRDDISLREKIKQIQKELNSNITPDGGDFTVLELVEKYISQKTGVRHNTRSYNTPDCVNGTVTPSVHLLHLDQPFFGIGYFDLVNSFLPKSFFLDYIDYKVVI